MYIDDKNINSYNKIDLLINITRVKIFSVLYNKVHKIVSNYVGILSFTPK